MRVLVTGARGFLGRSVVPRLVASGHTVRALVRPSTPDSDLVDHCGNAWPDGVEVARGDLRHPDAVPSLLDGAEAIVHLAARVVGDESQQFADTVVGTENLLRAIPTDAPRRMVFASSLALYDWARSPRTLTEKTPLESDHLYERDNYAITKTWQERLVDRYAERTGAQVTTLRPGLIWGPGREDQPCIGQRHGRFYLVFGPSRALPLTHVDNCADAFAFVLDDERTTGRAFNVVDGHAHSVWGYTKRIALAGEKHATRVPVPYLIALLGAKSAKTTSRLLFGKKAKLPSILVPYRFVPRFRPLRFTPNVLQSELGWNPPHDYEACVRRTIGGR